ncbi:hypothetical protein GBA52_025776 [Prunus armeniaca]|nr:hypothetical protein GBA52_025776 [Prunus armeniaca]
MEITPHPTKLSDKVQLTKSKGMPGISPVGQCSTHKKQSCHENHSAMKRKAINVQLTKSNLAMKTILP